MLGINPGSEQVRYNAERDGLIDTFNKFESTRIFTNAMDLVLDNGTEKVLKKQEKNSIFILLTETLKSQTEIQTHMMVKVFQKW